jgi:hypothetical protein
MLRWPTPTCILALIDRSLRLAEKLFPYLKKSLP